MRASDNLIVFALRLGFAALSQRHWSIGIKRLLYPVGYWRYPIFRQVQALVGPSRGLRVLDIGSPKLLALWLAAERECGVHATDYQDSAIFDMWDTYYQDLTRGRPDGVRTRLRSELQDARTLSYADDSFDLVYSLSVVEHIPGDGDSVAMNEIGRVLRPGGRAIIEVPFAFQEHDTYVHRAVYGKPYDGTPVFYQRHYTVASVHRRLIAPSRLRLVASCVRGERWPFEKWWGRLPSPMRAPLYGLEWIAATMNLRDLGPLGSTPERYARHAMDVTLVFEKPTEVSRRLNP
jgi:SAM-dependent methyltransferase